MTDLIFSTVVGFATYSLLSWLIYQPKPKATTTTKVAVAPTVTNTTVDEVEADLWDSKPENISAAIAPARSQSFAIDEPVAEIETVEIDEPVEADETAEIDKPIAEIEPAKADETIEPTTLTLVDNEIEIDKLPLTICKKIAGQLTKKHPQIKISQTVNGTSKPVSQLRSEIKNRIGKEPKIVTAIIQEVMMLEQSKQSIKTSTKKPVKPKTRNLKAAS